MWPGGSGSRARGGKEKTPLRRSWALKAAAGTLPPPFPHFVGPGPVISGIKFSDQRPELSEGGSLPFAKLLEIRGRGAIRDHREWRPFSFPDMNSKKRPFHRKGLGSRAITPVSLFFPGNPSFHQGEPEPASGPVAPSISLLLSGGRVLKGAFPFGQSFPASLKS